MRRPAQHRTGLTLKGPRAEDVANEWANAEVEGESKTTEQKWVLVADTQSYTPTTDDVGHMLRAMALLLQPGGCLSPQAEPPQSLLAAVAQMRTLYASWAAEVERDGWQIASLNESLKRYLPSGGGGETAVQPPEKAQTHNSNGPQGGRGGGEAVPNHDAWGISTFTPRARAPTY